VPSLLLLPPLPPPPPLLLLLLQVLPRPLCLLLSC
jgi:hypothetical protein